MRNFEEVTEMNITGSRDGKVFFIDNDKVMIDGKMYYEKAPHVLNERWKDAEKEQPENSNPVWGKWLELCGDVKLWKYAVVTYNSYGQGEWMKDTEVVNVEFWQEIEPPVKN